MSNVSLVPAATAIVFVPSDLTNLGTLLAGLPPEHEVHVLDPLQDGLRQIAATLAEKTDIAALHLITHGAPGKLFFGNVTIGRGNLADYTDTLDSIAAAFAENGELLIYGCEVAAGQEGRRFIDALSDMTGLKVAAATHKVGSEKLGGRWELDAVPPAMVSKPLEVKAWHGVLASLINGLGGSSGFGENDYVRSDDPTDSTGIDLTSVFGVSGVKFGSNWYTKAYINNNGMITFGAPATTFTPNGLSAGVSNGSGGYVPAIALYWTDLNTSQTSVTASAGGTSTGTNLVHWDIDTGGGKITITWDDVQEHSFIGAGDPPVLAGQIILTNAGSGNMDIQFRYEHAIALQGHTVTAGWNVGVSGGTAGVDYYEVPIASGTSSGQYGVLADLDTRTGNSGEAGLSNFYLRGGGVSAKSLSYSATTFDEAGANDGSITATVTITLVGDTFTGSDGDDWSSLVSNVPIGLSAVLTRTNATTATLSFTGNATAHANAQDVSSLTVAFTNGYFTSGSAAAVSGATTSNLAIDFDDPVNNAPVITSNGGNPTAAINVAENTTAVTTVTATDSDAGQTLTYAITGGADQAKFGINTASGVLSFLSAPDFENPTDTGSNNTYEVIVAASDNLATDTQTITVSVTDVVPLTVESMSLSDIGNLSENLVITFLTEKLLSDLLQLSLARKNLLASKLSNEGYEPLKVKVLGMFSDAEILTNLQSTPVADIENYPASFVSDLWTDRITPQSIIDLPADRQAEVFFAMGADYDRLSDDKALAILNTFSTATLGYLEEPYLSDLLGTLPDLSLVDGLDKKNLLASLLSNEGYEPLKDKILGMFSDAEILTNLQSTPVADIENYPASFVSDLWTERITPESIIALSPERQAEVFFAMGADYDRLSDAKALAILNTFSTATLGYLEEPYLSDLLGTLPDLSLVDGLDKKNLLASLLSNEGYEPLKDKILGMFSDAEILTNLQSTPVADIENYPASFVSDLWTDRITPQSIIDLPADRQAEVFFAMGADYDRLSDDKALAILNTFSTATLGYLEEPYASDLLGTLPDLTGINASQLLPLIKFMTDTQIGSLSNTQVNSLFTLNNANSFSDISLEQLDGLVDHLSTGQYETHRSKLQGIYSLLEPSPPSSGESGSGNGATPPAIDTSIPTGIFDGVPANTTSTTNGGTTTTTTTIPVINETRSEDSTTTNNNLADIPLVTGTGGGILLEISAPVGLGLTSEKIAGSGMGLRGTLIAASNPKIVNPDVFTGVLARGIDAYVPTVRDEAQVVVRSLSFNVGDKFDASKPIIVTGAVGAGEKSTDNPLRQEALVLDTRSLPTGSTLQLNKVEFAIVVGEVNLMGGDGANFIVGDDYRQVMDMGDGDDVILAGGGNDVLSGGIGNDVLGGGDGDDLIDGGNGNNAATYADASAGVKIDLKLQGKSQDTGGAGIDTLRNIQSLIGSDHDDTLQGNQGSVANTLEGGIGNDTLNGRGGKDTASYADATVGVTVNLGLKMAQDTGGAGTDTLLSMENLVGSAHADQLSGSRSKNVLMGGEGADILTGGNGRDIFRYEATTEGGDMLTDFRSGQDKLAFSGEAFGGLSSGKIDAGLFAIGSSAQTAEQRFVFNSATNSLYYDADGSGGETAVLIGTFTGVTSLLVKDFVIL